MKSAAALFSLAWRALPASCACAATAAIAAEAPAGMPPQIVQIAAPTAPGAVAPLLQRGQDGAVWLAWLQPGSPADGKLCCAPWDADGNAWGPPRVIATIPSAGNGTLPSTAFAAKDSRKLAAAWTETGPGGQRVVACLSTDGGGGWTTPETLSGDKSVGAFPTLTALSDGRFLAAWIESKPGHGSALRTELHTRLLGGSDRNSDQTVDPSVNALSAPALAPFLDGGALTAYRGIGGSGIRDIHCSRFGGPIWAPARVLSDDRWIPDFSPEGGPALATDGGRVAVAWFTGAGGDPRLVASSSTDAGGRFLMPVRVETGAIAGGPSVVLLHDSAAIVLWQSIGSDGSARGLWMRRITPDFTLDPPALLVSGVDGSAVTAAISRDYYGGTASAQVVVAYASARDRALSVRTLALTIPEGALLAASDETCHCAPAPAELVGYPVRGTVMGTALGSGRVFLKHGELPGILPDATDTFRVAPELISSVKAGSRCLARIEKRNGEWWIFDIRYLVAQSP